MKYPVTYAYKIGNGKYYTNHDPDYNQLYEDMIKFFKDNNIQHKFVSERYKGHGEKGVADHNPDRAYWRILNETLYFYRTQDRNLFLLHFGNLYHV